MDLTVTVLNPASSTSSYFQAAVNWTKQGWTDQVAPPMPNPVNPAAEGRNIEWREVVERTEIRETFFINTSIEVSDFCPVWVSIDLRGENVRIEGRIRHECVAKEGLMPPLVNREYGDAPEGVIAYPVEGVVGMFPTCVDVGPASWIEHTSRGSLYFGPKVDFERGGNGGKCPTFAPDQYNGDETVSDSDAGLIKPRAYTIKGVPGSQTVSALTFSGLESIGNACLTATWGTTIDMQVNNKSGRTAYVNVLFDWNHDGVWQGSSRCDSVDVPEHVLVNFPVPDGYDGPAVGPGTVQLQDRAALGPRLGPLHDQRAAGDQRLERRRRLPGRRNRGLPAPRQGSPEVLPLELQRSACDALGPVARHAGHGDRRRSALVEPRGRLPCRPERAHRRRSTSGARSRTMFCPRSASTAWRSRSISTPTSRRMAFTPWSRPGTLLWTKQIPRFRYDFSEITNNIWEGWYEPSTRLYERGNHKRTFQYDICLDEDDDLFSMRLGTTYWIEIKEIPAQDTKYQFGWKTTKRSLQWGGNAVWRHPQQGWLSMVYPETHESYGKPMDLSLVIVGATAPEEKDSDFGDAPDPSYPTRLISNGAQHPIVPNVYLGRGVDGEADGQPNGTATGDDAAGTDDEDGVVFATDLIPGEPATLQVTASTQGALNAWIDWNADGDWDDGDEQVFTDKSLAYGVNLLTIDVPDRAAAGRTFARFRFSTARGLRYNGLAPDGEVEDYQVEIKDAFVPLPPLDHLKWSQPPIEQDPMSRMPVYVGWDEPAYASRPILFSTASWKLPADNFRCIGNMPVTSVHWWGSYQNWTGDKAPSIKPDSWRIAFWSHAQADSRYAFGRPDKLLWVVNATPDRVLEDRAGLDEFPTKPSDTAFRYSLALKSAEYFRQDKHVVSTQDRVFWISVTAVYTGSPGPQYPWGWKTRPRPWSDGAVKAEFRRDDIRIGFVLDPTTVQPIANSLLCERQDKYDMAFELDTDPAWIKWEQPFTGLRDWPYYEDEESLAIGAPGAASKWSQQPDTTSAGVDVDFTKDLPPTWPTTICADDFECRETGPVTSITLWASWYHDVLSGGSAENATFTLSIRQDIPADRSATGYSMPGKVLWQKTFRQGEFTVEPVQTYAESYYSPANSTFERTPARSSTSTRSMSMQERHSSRRAPRIARSCTGWQPRFS